MLINHVPHLNTVTVLPLMPKMTQSWLASRQKATKPGSTPEALGTCTCPSSLRGGAGSRGWVGIAVWAAEALFAGGQRGGGWVGSRGWMGNRGALCKREEGWRLGVGRQPQASAGSRHTHESIQRTHAGTHTIAINVHTPAHTRAINGHTSASWGLWAALAHTHS